jgi:hypothetical protein
MNVLQACAMLRDVPIITRNEEVSGSSSLGGSLLFTIDKPYNQDRGSLGDELGLSYTTHTPPPSGSRYRP